MHQRLTPEQILNKYDQSKPEGKLTIFLGAAAGVGKTYAMLKAIPELIKDGVDVVIGYIETHNRPETKALLLDNVEVIPLKKIEHKNHNLQELDLDAILLRKPELVIIDELAHSNVPGSRNLKRYQDVLELLAAGISVYTALNIQHIESLNDVVGQITGIKVNETVPDLILEDADEIKLIDVTPDELIERLKEGKIYPTEKALRALENFFRKGNLTALREMALLKTAQKVEQQVQEYRSDKAINDVWASHENLLVVLEPGYSSEKVIRSGKTMYDKGFSNWYVVFFDNGDWENKPLKHRQKLLNLLELAKSLGAETSSLVGSSPTEAIVDFAREHNINTVVLSQYRLSLYYRLFGTTLVAKLSELAPELNLHLIRDELTRGINALTESRTKKKIDYPKAFNKFLRNIAIFGMLGVVLLPFANYISDVNILMIYLLAIIVINHGRGKLSALSAAFVATISFDFFFIPPRFSLVIGDFQYLITFIVMTIVGSAFSVVTGNLRYQVGMLRKTQQQTRLLYEAGRKMAEAMVESQLIECVNEFLPQLIKAKYIVLLPNLEEELQVYDSPIKNKIDMAIAKWVFDNAQDAGLNTNTFAGSELYYVPINSKIRTRGVVAFLPNNPVEFFLPVEQEILDNFLSILVTSLERIHFTQIAIQTEILLAKQNSQNQNVKS